MAYTKFTEKAIKQGADKMYDILLKIGVDKSTAKKLSKLEYELGQSYREDDLQNKLERRQSKGGK